MLGRTKPRVGMEVDAFCLNVLTVLTVRGYVWSESTGILPAKAGCHHAFTYCTFPGPRLSRQLGRSGNAKAQDARSASQLWSRRGRIGVETRVGTTGDAA